MLGKYFVSEMFTNYLDMWLRKRNGEYELKYAPLSRIDSKAQQYNETGDKEEIKRIVSQAISSFRSTDTGITTQYGELSQQ